MLTKILVFISFMFVMVGIVNAGDTGLNFARKCEMLSLYKTKVTLSADQVFSAGYCAGVIESMTTENINLLNKDMKPIKYCIPDGVTKWQLAGEIVEYSKKHREYNKRNELDLLMAVLDIKFPCK